MSLTFLLEAPKTSQLLAKYRGLGINFDGGIKSVMARAKQIHGENCYKRKSADFCGRVISTISDCGLSHNGKSHKSHISPTYVRRRAKTLRVKSARGMHTPNKCY